MTTAKRPELAGMDRLAERLGPGVRDIERVQQERAQRKTWQERHEWIDGLLEERPDVTVGENRKEG